MNTVTVLDNEDAPMTHQMVEEEEVFDSSDFQDVLVTTDAGTPLEGETMRQVSNDLDGYLQNVRTGIMADEIRFPWNKVFQATGEDINNPNVRKILTFCEKQLETWLKNRPVGPQQISLDEDFRKEADKNLHAILKSAHNKIKIDGLVVAYCMKTERDLTEENTDLVREQLRAYIKTNNAYHITRGGMATVYRLKDQTGKSTGVAVDESSAPAGRGGSDNKRVQRFTASVKELGFKNKSQFERAKSDLKTEEPTLGQLKGWIEKQD